MLFSVSGNRRTLNLFEAGNMRDRKTTVIIKYKVELKFSKNLQKTHWYHFHGLHEKQPGLWPKMKDSIVLIVKRVSFVNDIDSHHKRPTFCDFRPRSLLPFQIREPVHCTPWIALFSYGSEN